MEHGITPEGVEGRERSRLLVSVADQVLSSGTNFLLVILVARTSSPTEFGLFSIAYGVLVLGLAVQRNAVGVPLGLDLPAATPAARTGLIQRSLGISLLLGVGLGVGIAVSSAVAGWPTMFGADLLVLAVAAPIVLTQDTLRYAAVACCRPGSALVGDGCWFVAVAIALPLAGDHTMLGQPVPAPVPWVLGAVVGLAVIWFRLRPGRPVIRGSVGWLRGDARRAHLAWDALLGSVAPVVVAVVTAWSISPAATAALRGASTMFGPINILLSVVSLAITPELSRRGLVRGASVVTGYCGALMALILVWGAVLILMPDAWGAQILGDTWPSAEVLFHIAVIEALCICVWSGSVAFLRVADQTKRALQLRVMYACVYVALAVSAAAWLGTASWVMWGMTTAGILVAAASALAAHRAVSTARQVGRS